MTEPEGLDQGDPGRAEPAGRVDEITLVGIGASAGGLSALRDFFRAVPADSGLAFVVIVHLDPDHQSQMASLLQSQTAIPVTQISESFQPQPNHVYVIPPNKNLTAVGDTVELGPRDAHAPIDLFLRTLADSYGAHAVGVVLSGTGSDGTNGIRSIHEVGGVTMAQSPDEAEYASMPRSAIATGMVDAVMAVGEMPERLVELKNARPRLSPPTVEPGAAADEPDAAAEEPDAAADEPDGAVRRIHQSLRKRTGHDFSTYKRSTFQRRVQRRMRSVRVETLPEYARLLEGDVEEVDRLFRDLLISVSSFFRDPDAWATLEGEVIPKLFEGKGPKESVRAWVAGCATGEEAYTLAILLQEHAATLAEPPRIQVFATDIDERACRGARAGVYPGTISADVSPARLKRFFQESGKDTRVVETLREMVLFASHDLLRDPPFSKLDLVTCRNLLIYLQPEAQDRVLRTFHYALRRKGHLFLGLSETAGERGLFAPVDSKSRIYVRSQVEGRVLLPPMAARPVRSGNQEAGETSSDDDSRGFSYGPLHLRMVEEYAPPSLVVDSTGRVVHLSPGAGRYVRLPGGVPKWDLVDLVPDDLRVDVRALLHEVFHDGEPAHRTVEVEIEGDARVVDLRVSAMTRGGGPKPYALVVFDERPRQEEGKGDDAAAIADPPPPDPGTVEKLEEEVARTRERLASALDERDLTVEKLQATNEELQSINEQHRTALEEMETANEELQSLNEELTTVNQEHQATIDELKHTTADLNNLLEASSVATIFLDRQLSVRRFSPSVGSMFNLTEADQGRPLAHFTHGLEYDQLAEDAERTLSTMQALEREVADHEGRWYSVRMRPYRFGDDRIGGVVITLYEITETKRQQAAEEEARMRAEAEEARLEALMRQLPSGVLVLDAPSGEVLSANERAHDIWGGSGVPFAVPPGSEGAGYSARSSDGTPLAQDAWPISRMLRTGMGIHSEEVDIDFGDGRHLVLLVNGVIVHAPGEPDGDPLGAIVTLLDITDRKAMEEELREARRQAEAASRTKGFFMSALSHEFRTPLNAILGYAELLTTGEGVTDDQRTKLGRIISAVEHLDAMIDEILGLAGLDASKEDADMTTEDVRRVVREASQICEPVVSGAGLDFGLELPDEPVELTTDHDRLRMILINLIGNAVKFTERGQIRLVMRPGADRLDFEVHDTGQGIAPENHELIFERFWQVSQGLTRTAGGVGIGLAAARELSRTLGGDIEVRSELGGGSVFTLWLPRSTTPPDPSVRGGSGSGPT